MRNGDRINMSCCETSCLVDNDISIHMTSWKHLFMFYPLGNFVVVKMGNDGVAIVVGTS